MIFGKNGNKVSLRVEIRLLHERNDFYAIHTTFHLGKMSTRGIGVIKDFSEL